MSSTNLLSQLKFYGLNPKDWSLYLRYTQPHQPLSAILQHREIAELKLTGYCSLNEGELVLNFKSLCLNSI